MVDYKTGEIYVCTIPPDSSPEGHPISILSKLKPKKSLIENVYRHFFFFAIPTIFL